MILLGDIHGEYFQIPQSTETIIQIGDFGIGFIKPPKLPKNVLFLRGNHDNPELARQHPNYIGEWGEKWIEGHKVFWYGGADSVDVRHRTPNVDWWHDEQISYGESLRALNKYHGAEIFLSHDAPQFIAAQFKIRDTSLTRGALEEFYLKQPPKIWIFGHHHRSFHETIGKTEFIGLDIGETYEIKPTKRWFHL